MGYAYTLTYTLASRVRATRSQSKFLSREAPRPGARSKAVSIKFALAVRPVEPVCYRTQRPTEGRLDLDDFVAPRRRRT